MNVKLRYQLIPLSGVFISEFLCSIQVMNNGQVKEFDSPYTLLQNPGSQFKRMVEQTGPYASRKLYQMAVEAYKLRCVAPQKQGVLHQRLLTTDRYTVDILVTPL